MRHTPQHPSGGPRAPAWRPAAGLLALLLSAPALAQVTFYQDDNYQGRSFTTQRAVGNFNNVGYNDRASSIVVTSKRWEVCDNSQYGGRCVVLRPGSYPSLQSMGLNDRVSSVRMVRTNDRIEDERYAPAPPPPSPWQRRNGERLFEANVTSVRAVVGPPEQRCWVEREDVVQQGGRNSNVPGALAGALIGGILGHQIGGGTGRDIATAGGVIAGAAVGSRVGSNGERIATQDVQKCRDVPGSRDTQYWDVSYRFRGQDHRVQMRQAPGPTVTVNRLGEPRG